jgi:hypothetical protein
MHANLTPFQSRLVKEYLPLVENTEYRGFEAARYHAALQMLEDSARFDTVSSRREADRA